MFFKNPIPIPEETTFELFVTLDERSTVKIRITIQSAGRYLICTLARRAVTEQRKYSKSAGFFFFISRVFVGCAAIIIRFLCDFAEYVRKLKSLPH